MGIISGLFKSRDKLTNRTNESSYSILSEAVASLPLHVYLRTDSGMEKPISMLDEVKESIINAYEIKTEMSRAKLLHLMDAEIWMNVHKAVELGFADDILKRSETTDMKVPHVGMMYSKAQVVNSLMDKLATKYKIENKETNKGIRVDSLMERLFL